MRKRSTKIEKGNRNKKAIKGIKKVMGWPIKSERKLGVYWPDRMAYDL